MLKIILIGALIVFAIILFALLIIPIFMGTDETVDGAEAQVQAQAQTQAQAPAQAQAQTQAQATCGSSYTVVAGDTFSEIAQRCGVSQSALWAANPQIANINLIYPGQVLVIPAPGSDPGIPVTGAYTVVSGDTLYSIAQRFNTTVAAIQAVNPQITNPNLIYPGQVINIPASGSDPGIPVTGAYVVQPGDTLYRIAINHATTVQTLLNLNPWITNPNLIYPGWVIQLPG
jgi:LysM repeat protein